MYILVWICMKYGILNLWMCVSRSCLISIVIIRSHDRMTDLFARYYLCLTIISDRWGRDRIYKCLLPLMKHMIVLNKPMFRLWLKKMHICKLYMLHIWSKCDRILSEAGVDYPGYGVAEMNHLAWWSKQLSTFNKPLVKTYV